MAAAIYSCMWKRKSDCLLLNVMPNQVVIHNLFGVKKSKLYNTIYHVHCTGILNWVKHPKSHQTKWRIRYKGYMRKLYLYSNLSLAQEADSSSKNNKASLEMISGVDRVHFLKYTLSFGDQEHTEMFNLVWIKIYVKNKLHMCEK